MRQIAFLLAALFMVDDTVASIAPASGRDNGVAAPIFGIKIYPGYRDWRLISVAHQEGDRNDCL